MRAWSLGQLTVIGVRPAELVEIAARAGYDAVDPFVGIFRHEDLPTVPLLPNDPDTKLMAAALKSNGIFVQNADGFVLTAETDLEECQRHIDAIFELGARSANMMIFDEDLARGQDLLSALDVRCQAAGISITIEFMAVSQIATPRAALDIIDGIGSSNIRLLFDPLHLSQADVSPGEIRNIEPRLIGGAQICDAPASLEFEKYQWMSVKERMAPGEGELPLVEFMAAFPRDMICSVEVPRLDEPDKQARAARMLALARKIDDQAQSLLA